MNNDFKDENVWLMQGDCLERMKEIPDGQKERLRTMCCYMLEVNVKC